MFLQKEIICIYVKYVAINKHKIPDDPSFMGKEKKRDRWHIYIAEYEYASGY